MTHGGEATFPWSVRALPTGGCSSAAAAAAPAHLPRASVSSASVSLLSSPAPSPCASPPLDAPPPASPPELAVCTAHVREGRVSEAVALSLGMMHRHAAQGAQLARRVLQHCEPGLTLGSVPAEHSRMLIKFVCDELRAACRGGGAGAEGAEASPPASAVPVTQLLQWLEAAVQQRRLGAAGDDHLAGALGALVARTLRQLSSSADPLMGVEGARLFALLGGTGLRAGASPARPSTPGRTSSAAAAVRPSSARPSPARTPGGLARLARQLAPRDPEGILTPPRSGGGGNAPWRAPSYDLTPGSAYASARAARASGGRGSSPSSLANSSKFIPTRAAGCFAARMSEEGFEQAQHERRPLDPLESGASRPALFSAWLD